MARRASIATAFSASPPICSMSPPKSSHSSMPPLDHRDLLSTARGGFRQFKHLLGCRHLLSHNQNGIEIQTYCAIIAGLVIALWTGRQPTKRTNARDALLSNAGLGHDRRTGSPLGEAQTRRRTGRKKNLIAPRRSLAPRHPSPFTLRARQPAVRNLCGRTTNPRRSKPRPTSPTATQTNPTANIHNQINSSAEQCWDMPQKCFRPGA